MSADLGNTPVMRQYATLKAAHPDALLLFRLGDFYEVFGADAETASGILGITLTRRRSSAGDAGVPMCGVPYHAAEGYLSKLMAAGCKVALAEQVETPAAAKARGGSGALIERAVVRVLTPGTLTEEAFLQAHEQRVLAALVPPSHKEQGGVAWLDLASGEVGVMVVEAGLVAQRLASLPIAELLVAKDMADDAVGPLPRRAVTVQPGLFALSTAEGAVRQAYDVQDLAGLGLPNAAVLVALGAVLGYASLTQLGRLPALQVPKVIRKTQVVGLDAATRQNLELVCGLNGRREDSLLGVLDACVTGPGSRLLARWVSDPLAEVALVMARQDAVRALAADAGGRKRLRDLLKATGDVARAANRLVLGRGSPRDLAALRQSGQVLPELQTALAPLAVPLVQRLAGPLGDLAPLTARLVATLADDPLPLVVRDGGFVQGGVRAELDEQRRLQRDGQAMLAALTDKEAAASGIGIKLQANAVWGHFWEVTKAELAKQPKVPEHWIHRQTTTGGQRFVSAELQSLERALAGAAQAAQVLEEAVFAELVAAVGTASMALLGVAESLATLDVLAALAEVGAGRGWVAPELSARGPLEIEGGKHPVVSRTRADFMPNDCVLAEGDLWLLTGPNMAGKSTFLRQVALLVVLAQLGSLVPAARMRLGVVDQIFCRLGSADNLAAGQSTFMVEMVETAQILHHATAQSLVILDELGRGTATYDGLAIAWACVEDLVGRVKARTLLATHYHELTALARDGANGLMGVSAHGNQHGLVGVSAHQMLVKEWQGAMVFLHQVAPGAAGKSYGVQVAKLAGVPKPVVARAAALLEGFSKASQSRGVVRMDELSLFAAPVAVQTAPEAVMHPVVAEILATDLDGLSARQALELLHALQSQLKAGSVT